MTIAEIVRGLIVETDLSPKIWSQSDYKQAWLVRELFKATRIWYRDAYGTRNDDGLTLEDLSISPTDYADIERRVREWEKNHG